MSTTLNQRQVNEYMRRQGYSPLPSGGYGGNGPVPYVSDSEAWADARRDLNDAAQHDETPRWHQYQRN